MDLDGDCPEATFPEGALVRQLQIVNRKGLHARATAKLVQTVDRFSCDVWINRCGETVGGRSIMGLLTLGAGIGTTISVAALGDDAAEALDAIAALVADRFGEGE
ncbi:MAG: HPr family phosphocarrier protein [Bosea sp.]|jgi:phosphocarrier protein HPr|nr:HPr family phosphocarrier protein [Bosea sp. (in: a-proteobacteria)]